MEAIDEIGQHSSLFSARRAVRSSNAAASKIGKVQLELSRAWRWRSLFRCAGRPQSQACCCFERAVRKVNGVPSEDRCFSI